jgi:DNA-binding CsgD family transcriptional regulator
VLSFPDLMLQSIDGVFAIGAGQTVTFWNRACESITGIPAAKAIGSRCHEVLKGHDPSGRPLCKCDCPLGSLAKGGLPPSSMLPMRITHQDGKKIQLCVDTLLMPSPSHTEWTVVHVMRRSRESKAASFFPCGGIDQHPEPTLAQPGPDAYNAALLTSRERDVLCLLAEGGGAETISGMLHISSSTVRNHIQRLMAKLNVHSRHEAVAFAHRHNMAGKLPVLKRSHGTGQIGLSTHTISVQTHP